MLYAITNASTANFEGFYDDTYADMDVDSTFIEIDETKRADLIANPKQRWAATAWEAITPTFAENKAQKIADLKALKSTLKEFDYTIDAYTGTAWVERVERLNLATSMSISTATLRIFLNVKVATSLLMNGLIAIENYEVALDEWEYDLIDHITGLETQIQLDAVNLNEGKPTQITISLYED